MQCVLKSQTCQMTGEEIECVHAPEMLLVVERGEHDAADPEGATADGPVVVVVLAKVGRERVALLGAGEDVGQIHVDGEEAVQDPGLDAQ